MRETAHLLDDGAHYEEMARAHNPYGDGEACARIISFLTEHANAE
jgi:UDP-N-acetylglucosamine 2-epimerase (non-hydrolysing)